MEATILCLVAAVLILMVRSFLQSRRIARLEDALQRYMNTNEKSWETFDRSTSTLHKILDRQDERIDGLEVDLSDTDKELRETRGIVDGMIE